MSAWIDFTSAGNVAAVFPRFRTCTSIPRATASRTHAVLIMPVPPIKSAFISYSFRGLIHRSQESVDDVPLRSDALLDDRFENFLVQDELALDRPADGTTAVGGNQRHTHRVDITVQNVFLSGINLVKDGGPEHTDILKHRQRADIANARQKPNAQMPRFQRLVGRQDSVTRVDIKIEKMIPARKNHHRIIG